MITGIAFAPDGKFVAAAAFAGVPRVAFFDVRTGRQVKVFVPPDRPGGYVTSVAISPDSTKLIWGEDVGNVVLWDLTRERLLHREKLHEQRVTEVRFSPDGTVTATASDDGTINLRRVGNPAEVVRDFVTGEVRPADPGLADRPPARFPAGPFHLAFHSRWDTLGVSGPNASAGISVWRIKDGQQLQQIDKAHGNREGSTAALIALCNGDGRRPPYSVGRREHGANFPDETEAWRHISAHVRVSVLGYRNWRIGQELARRRRPRLRLCRAVARRKAPGGGRFRDASHHRYLERRS